MIDGDMMLQIPKTWIDRINLFAKSPIMSLKGRTEKATPVKAISFAHKNVAPIVQEHWKELQHHSKSTSQTKSGTNLRTSGLHLTYKPPKGDTSVSNLSISFPTNPQPTNLAHDPSPPTPLARRPRIPPFCVLAKDDWCITFNLLRTEAPSLNIGLGAR
ncbi:hypothetical protein CEXT_695791 [Caerostris extrusa]|uniref:Uncharacterized protein n=1 Tax=Caerostris extrusa TaxID=172846 RepID=A0AAV4ULE2_CAEEX|nr:hypothetical protein CEXT_695791 [Caerostris extrusa]